LTGVKVIKQKGFGQFDIAGYWRRKYRVSGEDEGWYFLTNIGNFKKAVSVFKCRSGIEAMFKDCKTGGYNGSIPVLQLCNLTTELSTELVTELNLSPLGSCHQKQSFGRSSAGTVASKSCLLYWLLVA
jgi:hypothetical protein